MLNVLDPQEGNDKGEDPVGKVGAAQNRREQQHHQHDGDKLQDQVCQKDADPDAQSGIDGDDEGEDHRGPDSLPDARRRQIEAAADRAAAEHHQQRMFDQRGKPPERQRVVGFGHAAPPAKKRRMAVS